MSSSNKIKSSSRTAFGEKKTFASWSKNYKRGKINSTDNLSCDFDSTSPNSPKKTTPTNKKICYSGKNMKNSNFSPKNDLKEKKVKFKKNFLQVINVESWKKYNLDNSNSEPVKKGEKIHCRCLIF